jgi:hypothetical protein
LGGGGGGGGGVEDVNVGGGERALPPRVLLPMLALLLVSMSSLSVMTESTWRLERVDLWI